ncbi:MAG TPA: hypothetical protein DCQ06_06225 [Myxococcales bacterium]|nr:hypothetical protein [Myxococcales bacterium]
MAVRHLLVDLTPKEAEEVTAFAYKFAWGYARLDHQLSGLHPFETAFLDRYPAQRVYVAACGGGRELVAIAKRGLIVDGAEPSSALRRAASKGLGAPVMNSRLQDLLEQTPPIEPYDLVLVGWGGWSHVVESDERIAILEALRPWVTAKGALCLSWPLDQGSDQFCVTPSGAIVASIEQATICAEAQRAGWLIDHVQGRSAQSYPHAYLVKRVKDRGD